MNDQEKKIQQLVRLKRYEKPRDGYFEDFLAEFQERRDQEITSSSKSAALAEKSSPAIVRWFTNLGSTKWVAGAGIAYAAVMATVFLWPKNEVPLGNPVLDPVNYEPIESPNRPNHNPATDSKDGGDDVRSSTREEF